ncbi:MAG: T9SS type A sorting domain-containing protein [Bacteroidales bacterium]
MSYKRFLIGIVVIMAGIIAKGQDYDSLRLAQLPKLLMPDNLKTTGLPYKLDNSRTKYFPAIFTQFGYSCNQAASISVGFTYELNALRNVDAYYPENRLPAFFTWNMMNQGKFETGVSYFESWDMVHAIGCPNWVDYGSSFINETRWMSGYYRYYHGMQNRVEETYSIDVSSEEGLQTLKHWLYDHLGDYQPGGVAYFQLATLDLQFWPLPPGTEDAGKIMIPWFGYAVGHAMTFVGYNDSVRFDFNRDGSYTNDLDTNGDGKVTMADWEIGALICVNTYGPEWGTDGRAYVPYRLLPLTPEQGGIWQKSVMVAKPNKSYKPLLTLRARVRYPDRSKLRITAGVSQDPAATEPQFILDQPVFHYQGGALPMQGVGPSDPELIEIGIDATPLLSHVETGKPATFFLVVCEQDPDAKSSGTIEYFSFNEYRDTELEHNGNQRNVSIDKPFLALPVVLTPEFNGPVVVTSELPIAAAGEEYQLTLDASGGTPPYKWLPANNRYSESEFAAPLTALTETRILPDNGNYEKKTVSLPFDFLYGGKNYREITITGTGGIVLVQNELHIPYGIELRELLGLNQAIYPFYSTELQYTEGTDGVFYEAHKVDVTIYWNASIIRDSIISDVNFAVRLFANGTIEFLYGDVLNSTSSPWLVGLTGGSKSQSLYPAINATGIKSGLNLRFQPFMMPAGIQISREGVLTCKPLEYGKTWTVPVCVEDNQGLQATRELSLSTGPSKKQDDSIITPKVRIFPNPVADKVQIQITGDRSGTILINIIDLSGKTLLTETNILQPGSQVVTIETTSELVPGIYILEITGATTFRSKIYFSESK